MTSHSNKDIEEDSTTDPDKEMMKLVSLIAKETSGK